MEEENKVQATNEPNPDEDKDKVDPSDVSDDGSQDSQTKPTGDDGGKGDSEDKDKDKDPKQQKQSRKTDAEYARERRERKAREEAERKRREDEIRRQAVFEVKSGQVTADELGELGLSKVENDDQLFLVESFRKAKADGAENPQAEAYKALFKKQADEKAKALEAEAKEKAMLDLIEKDKDEFQKQFGTTTKDVLEQDKEFVDAFAELIKETPGKFTKIYAAYAKLKKGIADKAKRDGAFPTGQNGSSESKNADTESAEEFQKRWIAEHGHW